VGGDGGCGVLQHRRGKGVRNCKKMQGLATRGGAYRGVADGGGARPESTRESGLSVAGGGGPGAGSGGEAWALERRGRRGVETGGQVEQRERGASGSVAARQKGKEEGKVRVPRGVGVPWGLAPTGGWRPAAAQARRWRATCVARALPAETGRRETSDGWAATQCRAAGLAYQRPWVRECADTRGPAREETGTGRPDAQ
jgi:hypothetical protein